MPQALAIFVSLLFLSTVFVGTAWAMAYRITPEHRRPQCLRWLLHWCIRGLLVPLALWTFMNLGVSWSLQPFMPQVQAAQNTGGDWVAEFLRVLAAGLFISSSYWTAMTLGWSLVRASAGLEGEPRSDFKALCWTCSIGMSLPAVGIVFLGGWPVLGLAATAILSPIAGYAPTILRTRKMPPMYARAIAKMKFGKYTEAEWEIIHELEKCEDDFDGWMMLAELYAYQFHDLVEAEQTVLEICGHPKTTPSQLSIALHRLADWHLKLASDPEAARRDLQMICDRLQGTHLAHMAQLRLNQLPLTTQELREQHAAQPIPLPALGDSLDEDPVAAESELDHDQAVETANACVERLKQDPNNVAAREKLARILAERLNQAHLGIEQIGMLLDLPDQEDHKRAEWLGLTAAWHIKFQHDLDAGRQVLERLVREFPHTPQAFAAQRRLHLMDRAVSKPA
jgi:hypothetical protein